MYTSETMKKLNMKKIASHFLVGSYKDLILVFTVKAFGYNRKRYITKGLIPILLSVIFPIPY
jgi:hypothetical protein